jgi:hypothetical protein
MLRLVYRPLVRTRTPILLSSLTIRPRSKGFKAMATANTPDFVCELYVILIEHLQNSLIYSAFAV